LKSIHFSRFQLFVHIASWIPLIILVSDWINGNLTVNPIQAVEQRTGQYAIVWLLLSLACTPFNTVFGFRPALKVRRALGLYAFFYASLHFLTFFGLDYGFNLSFVLADFGQKRFIIIGLSALLILVPLAITSTRGWMKRLGKKWHTLHRLAYPTGILVVIHYIWSVKADYRQPVLYGGILTLLLVLRLPLVRRWVSNHRLRNIPRSSPPARNKLTGTDPDPGLK
jgi:sulfoxide reductase heme-binding subunit YedZ